MEGIIGSIPIKSTNNQINHFLVPKRTATAE
jgi:hypothetical protein